MMANPRAIVAIIENFQQEDGTIAIPRPLHKYLPTDMREMAPKHGN
jgi:seryl-tRNA synthetase